MKKSHDISLALPEYREFIEELKGRVLSARLSAARAMSRDMILLYWDIGHGIVEKQRVLGWGESVIDRISADLRDAVPAVNGFSPRNLRDMKRFFCAYSEESIWRQAVAKLKNRGKGGSERVPVEVLRQLVAEVPWGHHTTILNKFPFTHATLICLMSLSSFCSASRAR